MGRVRRALGELWRALSRGRGPSGSKIGQSHSALAGLRSSYFIFAHPDHLLHLLLHRPACGQYSCNLLVRR